MAQGEILQAYYQEQAILWLARAFDHTHPLTAEDCLDRAIACLRMAEVSTDSSPPAAQGHPEDLTPP